MPALLGGGPRRQPIDYFPTTGKKDVGIEWREPIDYFPTTGKKDVGIEWMEPISLLLGRRMLG